MSRTAKVPEVPFIGPLSRDGAPLSRQLAQRPCPRACGLPERWPGFTKDPLYPSQFINFKKKIHYILLQGGFTMPYFIAQIPSSEGAWAVRRAVATLGAALRRKPPAVSDLYYGSGMVARLVFFLSARHQSGVGPLVCCPLYCASNTTTCDRQGVTLSTCDLCRTGSTIWVLGRLRPEEIRHRASLSCQPARKPVRVGCCSSARCCRPRRHRAVLCRPADFRGRRRRTSAS